VPTVDVNGARLWYDEAGSGDAVLLLHGGLGDSGLWEPVVPFLAERFRTIRTDLRFYGRSTGPAVPWSWQDDAIGVLDELGVERAALVGLSLGGKLALDVALAHPERLWAVVGVAPALGGHAGNAYTEEHEARYEAAEAEGNLEAAMEIDLEVWAPLGADERIRQLWHATPDANGVPPGIEPLDPPGAPAKERLAELAVPALVVTAKHDPPGMREIGPLVARDASGARHVELDSDHYVTLREPELLSRVLLEFLAAAAPQQ
jgi:3-oxoadipate enol-lactonase